MSRLADCLRTGAATVAAVLLAACASGPPPPDWQINARLAIDNAVAAHLEGNARVAAAELARARDQLARTGRLDLLARAELMYCAAQVASLQIGPCAEFEKLRDDAAAAERAYADYLRAQAQPSEVALLPPAHRTVADRKLGADTAAAALRAIDDPLARLIAAAVLLQDGRAGPPALQSAVDTASAQGWRRPLLAWLNVQLRHAETAGAAAEAERLRRRIEIVGGGR